MKVILLIGIIILIYIAYYHLVIKFIDDEIKKWEK